VEAADVASTEEAKRLTGKDEAEAETVGRTAAATGMGVTAGISKTARHRGHLNGALLISFGKIFFKVEFWKIEESRTVWNQLFKALQAG